MKDVVRIKYGDHMRRRHIATITAGLPGEAVALEGGDKRGGQDRQDHESDISTSNSVISHGKVDRFLIAHQMDGGPALREVKDAPSPKRPVDTMITLEAESPEGMEGAKAPSPPLPTRLSTWSIARQTA